MREILFRGKDKDGNWVEGDLIHGVGYYKSGKLFILPIKYNLAYVPNCDPLDGVEVIHETVGQFTGLLDKNGVKGFFDISIWKVTGYEYQNKTPFGRMSGKEDIYFVLKMDGLRIVPQILNKVNTKCLSLDVVFNPIQKSGKRLYIDKYRQTLEIVGNIHDNPELLNQ